MLLVDLLSQFPEVQWKGNTALNIQGIAYDSRTVQKGDLFVAIKGMTTDGKRYVPQALSAGASAIAAEGELPLPSNVPALVVSDARHFLAQASRILFDDPASKLRLAAATGTNGKTTMVHLQDSIFRAAGLKTCISGTLGMRIGDQAWSSERTTPESSDLVRFLQKAVQSGCTHGCLEVSSHALSLKRVYGTRFQVASFSNLTPEHLDFHVDMESYYQAKRLLFLPQGENHVDVAVINVDDPWGRRLVDEIDASVCKYGFDDRADVYPLAVSHGTKETQLRIHTPLGLLQGTTRLMGRPNTYNTLAVVAMSIALGLSLEDIRAGIETADRVAGRMEGIEQGQRFRVLVDYAHTPDALRQALVTLSELPHSKIITAFGCGGDRDRSKRPLMGEIAATGSDIVFLTSDNPRTEDPFAILRDIEVGARRGSAECHTIEDRREAILAALSRAEPDDIVLIAGKGHEGYQVVGERRLPFDDRQVARAILEQLLKQP